MPCAASGSGSFIPLTLAAAAQVLACCVLAQDSGQIPAFPGAEGYGAQAFGGRGGEVYHVTNLKDAGPGSLRDALSRSDRTVVFRVSGTITLESTLRLDKANVTIAGQTAPGDGITLRGHELMISNTQNVIVRFIRFRPGDETKAEHDGLSIRNSGDVLVDHCSMSWSTDSLNDVTHGSGNVTIQWCILSEPLNASVHVKGAHGYGTGWDGRIKGGGSFHHNLLAHCNNRAPRVGYHKEGRGQNDFRNNVIYNTGEGSAYGGETGDFNYVANYYRPGPSTKHKDVIFDIWSEDSRMFVDGNVIEGFEQINADNRLGVRFRKGSAEQCLVNKPFDRAPVTTHNAAKAYQLVTQLAGAMVPNRDAVDLRILEDVKNGTGGIIDSQAQVGGWPELRSAPAPVDGDQDGMPDEWEKARDLDPADASDGRAIAKDAGGYTNLEVYLNELARPAMPADE